MVKHWGAQSWLRLGCARLGMILLVSLVLPAAARAQGGASVEDLQALSIDDLANLEVTSVSKHREALSQAPAAIYVITAEDIRRSGASSLPEALRLAPNLEVARINASSYAITARGMNSAESANKLLVLIDGRSVYEPIGSGVLWQQVDVLMANVDRIEVVSGPGGTLWGANAVNGVINVITKSAADTQGLMVQASGGNYERNADLRLGGALGQGSYRVSVTAFDRSALPSYPGDSTDDAFRGGQAGFRIDQPTQAGAYSVIGNAYSNRIDQDGGDFWGGNLAGHWNRRLANGSDVEVQAYVARDDRTGIDLKEKRDTYNIQAQQAWTVGAQQLVWGGEYRLWREYFLSTNAFTFAKPRANISLGALFAQDQIALRPDLNLTLGLKLEDNSYSGLDWLPNVRLAWTLTPDSLAWGAVSRAVRTPNRIERELQATGWLSPAPDFQSETLLAYELGYRAQVSSHASFSISAFYNVYDDLRTDSAPGFVLPLMLANDGRGKTYGVEAWGAYSVRPWWRLKAGFNTLRKDFKTKPGTFDFSQLQIAGMDPSYQAQLRSEMKLSPDIDLDVALRRVDEVTRPTVGPVVPGYTEADLRLAWRVKPQVEVALEGFNLLNDHHLEIDDATTTPLRSVPRSLALGLRWGF
jgi:iron complex outermembrane receptor protein